MKTFYLTALAFFVQISYGFTQNYYHIYNSVPISIKSELINFLDFWVDFYDIENATFTIKKDKLPSGINGAIEYGEAPVANRKMILIRINKYVHPRMIMEVMAHEMVHAYQFYSKDLVRCGQEAYIWKGKLYKNILEIRHRERPWEIEAKQQAQFLLKENS